MFLTVISILVISFYQLRNQVIEDKLEVKEESVEHEKVDINLYPSIEHNSDRIVEQIDYELSVNHSKIFKILVWRGVEGWGGIQPQVPGVL